MKANFDSNSDDYPVQLQGDGVEDGVYNMSLEEAAALGAAITAIVETIQSVRLKAAEAA